MEYVVAALVAAVVAGAVVLLTQRSRGAATGSAQAPHASGSARSERETSGPTPEGAVGAESEGGPVTRRAGEEARTEPVTAAAPARTGGSAAGTGRGGGAGARETPAGAPREGAATSAAPTETDRAPDGGSAGPAGTEQASAEALATEPPTAAVTGRRARVQGSGGGAPADGLELELRERRAEIARIEERLITKERGLDARLAEVGRREQSLEDRARNLSREAENLKQAKREHVRELERIASLSAGQAKQILLQEVENDLKHERARLIRNTEEEAKRDAERRARSILAACMQRLASGHAAETTVTVVSLNSDELKGRIIGREGRNIRSLETLTGIDFIIDDTPGVVALSGFDGVRREVARLTLEKLLQDGRIHPARIEEAYYQSRSEIDNRIIEVGEQAVFEAGIGSLHPELTKLLGRLHYRTSYGQNVLAHSVECAHLAAMISEELGASAKTARRAALLHDIGKAVTHEIEGPHALVGGQLARRHREAEAVAHAMEAHHNEVDVQTIEAVVVQIADALSGARPGARGESLEGYTKRLRDLEQIASRRTGVDRVYAMQAGREIRVLVSPEDVDDDTAAILSHEIARDVERELEYPGQIKVTVIRESRATDYAK